MKVQIVCLIRMVVSVLFTLKVKGRGGQGVRFNELTALA